VLWFGDHPRLLGRYRVQQLTLDRAFVSEQQLAAHLATLFPGVIRGVSIKRVDFVNDTTSLEVRYETADHTPNLATEAQLIVSSSSKAAWS
jgi:hypothetical protein